MTCTECNDIIPFETEDVTVRVVFKDGHTERHCHHKPFDIADPNIEAILGSAHCADVYMKKKVAQRN
jgi:hypothetical protein